MERVRLIEHKGRKILLIDYSHLKKSEEVLPVINQLETFVRTVKTKQLFLTDATDGVANKEIMDSLKRVAKVCKDLDVVEKECIVGITGLKKVLLKAVNAFAKSNVVMKNSLEEAKDWLVE
ncbi:hypothetical protein NEF87_002919 [Candidatus Lokiarchaeum ossiferum]|uniref:STAS/SEC14 domain-containing protein n=1 Tax=Candidatus Lokiarchaeum ossiferum TaxID=2951803 RepID=A0ABY6HVZ5_9ARCH|nr:hypothetical protein NEF87_002919 [Candidatus Lokiarchaeum sp. B-35]